MNVTRKQVEYCFQQATQGRGERARFSQAYCVDRILELFAAAERPQLSAEQVEWLASTNPRVQLVAVSATVWGAKYREQMVCAPTMAEAVSVLRAALLTGAEKVPPLGDYLCQQGDHYVVNGECTACHQKFPATPAASGAPAQRCYACGGELPCDFCPAVPPVLQAEPVYSREFTRTIEAIRREAERAAFEKAAQHIEKLMSHSPAYDRKLLADGIRALADSPVSGEKP